MPVRRVGEEGTGALLQDSPPSAGHGSLSGLGSGGGRPGLSRRRGPPLAATDRPPPWGRGGAPVRCGGGARPQPDLGPPPGPVVPGSPHPPLFPLAGLRPVSARLPPVPPWLRPGKPGLAAPALVPVGRSGPALPGAAQKGAAGERAGIFPSPGWLALV